jgi:hypothetical protein
VAGYIHWMICKHITGYWQVLWTYIWKGRECQWYQY